MNRESLFKFQEIFFNDCRETTVKKNADYTADNADVFHNFTMVEELGFATTEQGILTRMTDKFSRLGNLVTKRDLSVKDETMIDTLKDFANYASLLAAYLHDKAEKAKRDMLKTESTKGQL